MKNDDQRIKKKDILAGKIFVYPTDTIYGLGCNALNKKAVKKLKELKKRDENKPLSVIAPSFAWIEENCIIDTNLHHYLPGQYTVILKKKERNFLPWISKSDEIGIRIPDHLITKDIQRANVPFITTSVNISGEKPIIHISEIPPQIKNTIDIIVDGGMLNGKPSTIIKGGKEIKRV